MTIKPDDLHVGQWVAVTYESQPEYSEDMFSPFFGITRGRQKPRVTGDPLKILAISLPFVCVSDGDETFSIDIRDVSFTRLHKKYVREMLREIGVRPSLDPISGTAGGPSPKTCPLCGEGMVESKTAETEWRLCCRGCGFGGGWEAPKS